MNKKNGEAVFGAILGLPQGHFYGPTTLSKDPTTLYLFLPGQTNGNVMLKGLVNKINDIQIIGTSQHLKPKIVGKISWSSVPGLVFVDVPQKYKDPYMTVLKLKLDDTEKTKQTVSEVISWYKKYREILNSDIIHLRRADGRDWDGILHVNPDLKTKGLMMLYNPLSKKITRTIKLFLYYTGLTKKATITGKEGKVIEKKLDRNYGIEFTFMIAPESYEWFVIE